VPHDDRGGDAKESSSNRREENPKPRLSTDEGAEPDARFSFANERTFLAWNRTALALLVAGLAITQLLPPFRGIPSGRRIVGIPLIVLSGVLALTSYRRWAVNERALRLGTPIPHSRLPRVLAMLITMVAVGALILVVLSRKPGL
jgi:putative membrane protein